MQRAPLSLYSLIYILSVVQRIYSDLLQQKKKKNHLKPSYVHDDTETLNSSWYHNIDVTFLIISGEGGDICTVVALKTLPQQLMCFCEQKLDDTRL